MSANFAKETRHAIARLLLTGESYAGIARLMGMSTGSVRECANTIIHCAGLRTRIQFMAFEITRLRRTKRVRT